MGLIHLPDTQYKQGDKMEYLTSMSTNDFVMGQRAKELAATDTFYNPILKRNSAVI